MTEISGVGQDYSIVRLRSPCCIRRVSVGRMSRLPNGIFVGVDRINGLTVNSFESSSLQSSPSQALSGKTILVTRAAGQSSAFRQRLEHQGATVLDVPTLEIRPPSSWQPLDDAIAQIEQFDWLILTSVNGVEALWQRLAQHGRDRLPAGLKLAVVGQKTAQRLQQRGIEPDFIPPDYVADSLVTHFPVAGANLRILFPRVESGGRDVLVRALSDQGAQVTEVAAYESGCVQAIAPELWQILQAEPIDVLTFASSKTVQCFAQLTKPLGRDRFSQCCIASIGPQTSLACQRYLGRVDVEAQDYTLEGLTQALVQWATQASK
jgi:uroporphyrinogen III methyltransferase/synthase